MVTDLFTEDGLVKLIDRLNSLTDLPNSEAETRDSAVKGLNSAKEILSDNDGIAWFYARWVFGALNDLAFLSMQASLSQDNLARERLKRYNELFGIYYAKK